MSTLPTNKEPVAGSVAQGRASWSAAEWEEAEREYDHDHRPEMMKAMIALANGAESATTDDGTVWRVITEPSV